MHALLKVNFYYSDSYYVAKLMNKSELYCNQEFIPLYINLVNDEHSGLTVLLKWSVLKIVAHIILGTTENSDKR